MVLSDSAEGFFFFFKEKVPKIEGSNYEKVPYGCLFVS